MQYTYQQGTVCAPTGYKPTRRPTQEYPWVQPQVLHLCEAHDCAMHAMTVEACYSIRLEWATAEAPCDNCGGR